MDDSYHKWKSIFVKFLPANTQIDEQSGESMVSTKTIKLIIRSSGSLEYRQLFEIIGISRFDFFRALVNINRFNENF